MATTLPFAYSRAYCIGVAKYKRERWELKTPLKDAEDMKTLLDQQGFDTATLYNPTKTQLEAFFQRIEEENSDPNGRVLIYYAGHGMQRDSAYGLKGYFVPVDAKPDEEETTMVPMEDLQAIIAKLKTRHVLLILDCCFAGTFRMPTRRDTADASISAGVPIFRQHYEIYSNLPSRLVLTSTSHRQKAFDRLEDGDANSPFNRFLRRAIEGAADYTGDRLVTATEIKTYLNDHVSGITEFAGNLQSTGLDGLEGDGEGEFLFFMNGFDASTLPVHAYVNPYKGLESYDAEDAALFYGRQKATKALIKKAAEHDFVVVVGASGSGKSSLVKAGLIPHLKKNNLQVAIMRPGKNPMAALPDPAHYDVLVIDQWEEVITRATDDNEVAAFYQEVRRLLEQGKRIIGTVRSDFEAQVTTKDLKADWANGRFPVPILTSEEFRDIIVQPAKRVSCLFEDRELIEEIETEVSQQQGALPLLSFMLSELFEKASKEKTIYREIKHAHYEEVKGVSGALSTKADAVMEQLPDDAHRDTMRRLMLRLVSLSGGETAGRRVLLNDLHFQDLNEDARVKEVIRQLREEARLIRSDKDDKGRSFVEPAHDALVRAWAQLLGWVKKLGEDNLILHNKLSAAVEDYQNNESNKSYLWDRDARLEQVRELLKKEPLLFNAAERGFTQASVRARTSRIWRTRILVAVVITGLAGLAAYAFNQQQIAEVKTVEAEVQRDSAQQNLAARIEQEKQKERLAVGNLMTDAESYLRSKDFDLALRKYYRADTTISKYRDYPPFVPAKAVLDQKVAACFDSIALPAFAHQRDSVFPFILQNFNR